MSLIRCSSFGLDLVPYLALLHGAHTRPGAIRAHLAHLAVAPDHARPLRHDHLALARLPLAALSIPGKSDRLVSRLRVRLATASVQHLSESNHDLRVEHIDWWRA